MALYRSDNFTTATYVADPTRVINTSSWNTTDTIKFADSFVTEFTVQKMFLANLVLHKIIEKEEAQNLIKMLESNDSNSVTLAKEIIEHFTNNILL